MPQRVASFSDDLIRRNPLGLGFDPILNLPDALVEEVMTRNLIIATPDFSLEEAMSLMTEQRFRHLPVIEGGKPIGIVSIGDLVKAKLQDVSVEVKYLRDYISA